MLKSEVGIFDLINAFQKVLKKIELKREDLREIFEESFTVSDKIDFIMRTVPGKKSVAFFDLFATAASRTEIAVTFLALLELIRMRQIRVFQDGPIRGNRNQRRVGLRKSPLRQLSLKTGNENGDRKSHRFQNCTNVGIRTMVTLKAVVEALLFASQKPLSLKEIAAALAVSCGILRRRTGSGAG